MTPNPRQSQLLDAVRQHGALSVETLAEALDRDPWLLFDLRGMTREEVLAALQAMLDAAAVPAEPVPRKRGRPKKVVSLADLLSPPEAPAEPWKRIVE